MPPHRSKKVTFSPPPAETAANETAATDIEAGVLLLKEGVEIQMITVVATKTLVLCSNGGDAYAVFRREGLTVKPDTRRDDRYPRRDLAETGRLLHYILTGGKVGGQPCTTADCTNTISLYINLMRDQSRRSPSCMDVVMGQIDQSLDDFRSLVRESESVASAVADHYDEWWLAPVIEQYEGTGNPIHDGDMVAVSPSVSNRIAEDFPDPDSFVPDRYDKPRQEDLVNRWTWIPFGAGRHRCVGAAFATMQIKAIFSVLLREYEFEMAQPADTYRNDHTKMVVQLARPAKVRYRKRQA